MVPQERFGNELFTIGVQVGAFDMKIGSSILTRRGERDAFTTQTVLAQ